MAKLTITEVMQMLNSVYVCEAMAHAALLALEDDPDSETMYIAVRFHAREVNRARRVHREAVARLVMQEEGTK
jgi:hypothetical protein